jgi:hypothetical protein
MEDEETNGRGACRAVADSHGRGAWGMLFSLINLEIAAGHSNYARNSSSLAL